MKVLGHNSEQKEERPQIRWYRVTFSGIYATTFYVEAYNEEEAEILARGIYNDASCDEFMEATSFELEDTYVKEIDM